MENWVREFCREPTDYGDTNPVGDCVVTIAECDDPRRVLGPTHGTPMTYGEATYHVSQSTAEAIQGAYSGYVLSMEPRAVKFRHVDSGRVKTRIVSLGSTWLVSVDYPNGNRL